ncbi:universal stress protein [Streptomyces griseoluteus]|uniref:Universal stress protein n=1 Tax=Streptomyces griseoluteus TaxID=29306 RepID=A0A4Z1DMB1_STRGP|nr:universal stress protein [Streptomyces griseoluteus]TGN84528.1 universal stress protein [Streptomyces griseoluteus]
MTVHSGEGPRIVVGVDGSESSKQALRWALRQAEVTGSVLEAVTAWEYPQLYGSLGWMPPLSEEEVDFERIAHQVLLDAVKEVAGPEPSVEMRTTVAFGPPTSVLLEASKGASLLVLGSRGHGGFTEALLGSVGQHCTHHATCPVVIIRGAPETV